MPGQMQAELNKVVSALEDFYARETHLFEKDLGERTLTHRLAVYLEKQFAGWEVDCDYNRLGERTLRLPKGIIVSTDDHHRQIGLSRYRRAPARDPQQPARRRSPEGEQPSAAGTRPAQAARPDRPASVVRLPDRGLSDAGQKSVIGVGGLCRRRGRPAVVGAGSPDGSRTRVSAEWGSWPNRRQRPVFAQPAQR